MPPIIQAENVGKVYHIGKVDVPALRGVTFSIDCGEFVSIVGPSGSGKSTLFYILGGLTRATTGRVVIDGADFAQLSDAQRTEMRKQKIGAIDRSEEHTSELQSRQYLVCRLLLEKKKQKSTK